MPVKSPPVQLILGSTSRYRHALLSRLRLNFDVVAPDVDESALPEETPGALARRLALAKARAVAALHPAAVVVGSDQVCELNCQALGKPGTHALATAQLRQLSGQTAIFHTAVAVVRKDTGFEALEVATVRTVFRDLSDAEIECYLRLDEPYDCAGSAKSETLGIALLVSIDSDDPTALVGLPLIRTLKLLRLAGIDPLQG